MKTVEISQELNAPVERVFAVFADHARYDRFPGVKTSELTRVGATDKNGVGAQRCIGLGAITLWEDIIGYETNALIEYRIVKAKPDLVHHELGRQRFEALPDGGTRVHWTSTFRSTLPIVGRFLEKPIAKQFESGFALTLRAVEKIAANS